MTTPQILKRLHDAANFSEYEIAEILLRLESKSVKALDLEIERMIKKTRGPF